MTREQHDLLKLLSYKLFGRGRPLEITEPILEEARQHAVASLLTTDYQVIARNIRVDAAHAELTDLLKGIPFVTMKGYASASYYPEPINRAMGDVDFYVRPEYYKAASERLSQNGFVSSGREHERHEAFNKDKVHFELHSEIKGIPNGKDGIEVASQKAEKIVRHYLDDVVDTAIAVDTQQGTIIIPDEFHHGLIMLLHVAGHILNDGGIGLRHICDWAVYVDKVDLSKYRAQLQKMGLWRFACQLTALTVRYLGVKKKPWCMTFEKEFLSAFMADVLNAGNFGRKTKGRKNSLRFAEKKDPLGVFAEITAEHYDFCKKYPFLLPVGMVLYVLRFIVTRLTGKYKWISISTLKKSGSRKNIYDQFGLFRNR